MRARAHGRPASASVSCAGEVVLEELGEGSTVDDLKLEFVMAHVRGFPRPNHIDRDADLMARDWRLFTGGRAMRAIHGSSRPMACATFPTSTNRRPSWRSASPSWDTAAQERGPYAGALAWRSLWDD